jgi:hypothetical protein
MAKPQIKETDLYPGVKRFLKNQGYTVKSEIEDCDILAVRGDEDPVIVELKTTLGLGVLLQAVQRKAISDKVYVAVPYDCAPMRTQYKPIIKLLRMLGLGLLCVHLKSKPAIAEALLDPGPYHPRKSKARKELLLREFAQRVGDPNQGGSNRRGGIMTAYRQKALRIARYLRDEGPTKAAVAAKAVNEPKTRNILYDNVYGWFDRIDTGIYDLSPEGKKETPAWIKSYPNLF